MVLPFSLFCFRFKNERRIFFSCPQTFLHFVPTLQCQICGFVFSTTAPSAIWTIWRIKLHTCVKADRYFQLWHTIINRIGSIGPVVNAHARYNFLYSHIYLHLSAPVKRCCPFYSSQIFTICLHNSTGITDRSFDPFKPCDPVLLPLGAFSWHGSPFLHIGLNLGSG